MINIICVGIGGCIGAIFRYIISSYSANIFVSKIPVGTLLVNILGGLLIGVIMECDLKFNCMSPQLKIFLTTGLMGGLTTFSTFSYETVNLLYKGDILFAILNITLNLLLSLLGVIVGKAII